jgi:hypothetical protein
MLLIVMSTVEGWTANEFKLIDDDSDSNSDSDSESDSDTSRTKGYKKIEYKKIALEEDLLPE